MPQPLVLPWHKATQISTTSPSCSLSPHPLQEAKSPSGRSFRLLSGLSAIIGVLLLIASFSLNPGPALNATDAQIIAFNQEHLTLILWGAWLQAIGPVFIVLFAFSLVCLAGATNRLAGWMTFFGGASLMMVSLLEITFYLSSLFLDPVLLGPISLGLIHAVQHLYFIVGAPALFLPLGLVLLSSHVLPRVLGYLALAMGATFAILGMLFLRDLTLPMGVTAFASSQILWWLAAAITLLLHPHQASLRTATRA